MDQVRIGILGAARIVAPAIIRPARSVPEVEVAAIAARNPGRAKAYARRHGIPRAYASYEDVIADPEIDAIYVPLPNSLHCEWTVRALSAGKHVLCEKPFAANAQEAQQMAAAAAGTNRVLMEAFHYRYHPLAARLVEIVTSGELGAIRHIETALCFPWLVPGDIRYRVDLAGGATMDMGCYAIHLLRHLAQAEPTVTQAEARLLSPQLDRWMTASFRFPTGCTGTITCSLLSSDVLKIHARVQGDHGELFVFNPFQPHYYHHLRVRTGRGTRTERVARETTYFHQLRAFASAVLHGAPTLTPPTDAIANMQVIDAVYRQAGLLPRGDATAGAVRTPRHPESRVRKYENGTHWTDTGSRLLAGPQADALQLSRRIPHLLGCRRP